MSKSHSRRSPRQKAQKPQEAPTTDLVPQDPPQEPVHSVKRLTRAEEVKILTLCKKEGVPQHLAAKALGCSESTISRVLSAYEDTGELARYILNNASADAAMRWAEIAKTSKRHDAAKELLLYNGTIQPLETDGSGAKVQILIGQPGAPVSIASTQVIDAVKVTGKDEP
jgi:predicted DNA-binding protein (UPF0251 family)